MGQKIHPLKFRLNTTETHKSIWYSRFKTFPVFLKEDINIRNFISNQFKFDSISKIYISRNTEFEFIKIQIATAEPWNLIDYGLRKLQSEIKKLVCDVKQVTVDIVQINEPNRDANLLADYVVDQLAKRVAFKRVMREVVKKVQTENMPGVKIQISGRLNGAEMARSEWLKEGRMPLQTLRASIDYASKKSKTIYGIMGVKIWIFKGESALV